MGIKYFTIEYDREVFYPGQMVSGRVRLSIDKPKEMRAIELTLSGKAKCHWTKRRSQTQSISCDGKETYFRTTLNLAGDGKKFELPIGDHVFPFSMSLPAPLPPSYSGKYGGIAYRGKAKLDLPWALDKSEKKHFLVESPIDLNKMTELNKPYKYEKSRTFCRWCCARGPLTVTVYIPRTGFVQTETIPMTIEVENASNVAVTYVTIQLRQIVRWKAKSYSKEKKTIVKSRGLDRVRGGASETWNEDLQLAPDKYPNTGDCGIIKIRYELKIEFHVEGPHSNLEMKTPITIADIPLGGSLPDPSPMAIGLVPPQPEIPPPGFGYSADPTLYPGDAAAALSLGGNAAPHLGAPTASYPEPDNAVFYPEAPGEPYSEGRAAPYPETTAGVSYPETTAPPGVPAVPYPGGAKTLYSDAAGALHQPNSLQSHGGASYPGAIL